MWIPLEGPPYPVYPNATFYFVVIAPASMSAADVSAWLSASNNPAPALASAGLSAVTVAPGNNWNVLSLHPGHVSGLYHSYQVIATWTGADTTIGAPSTDVTIPSYADMKLWVADTSQPAATPENTPPTNDPSPSEGGTIAWFVGGTILGLVGLYLLSKARQQSVHLGSPPFARRRASAR